MPKAITPEEEAAAFVEGLDVACRAPRPIDGRAHPRQVCAAAGRARRASRWSIACRRDVLPPRSRELGGTATADATKADPTVAVANGTQFRQFVFAKQGFGGEGRCK